MRNHWEIKRLVSICDTFADGDWIEKKDQSESGIRLVQTGNIGNGIFRNKDGNKKYISPNTFKRLHCTEVTPGDILVSRLPDPVGRSCIVPSTGERMITAVDCTIIRLKSECLAAFLVYYTQSTEYNKSVSSASTGSTRQRISRKNLGDILIPIPPLSEQKRIVDTLNREFTKIDTLKVNAEKSLKAAQDLFTAALSKELKHRKGWKETTIGDFCDIIRGKRFVRADIVEKGVPCIHYGDIYTHYGLFATKAKGCVSPDLAKKLRFANKNDVIVVAAGENKLDIGVGVAWLGEEPAVVHDACFILRHSQNPMFLSYYFRSTEYHQYLKDEVNEGKICSFLTKPLAEARISLPPLEEQGQIVNRLGIVFNNCKIMQENFQKTLSLCEDLKQALLRKAFNGEL